MIGYCPHCQEVKELDECGLCASCIQELKNEKIKTDLKEDIYNERFGGEVAEDESD